MAKRESGANGSRTRGFMLAPPYAQAMEMQGGGELSCACATEAEPSAILKVGGQEVTHTTLKPPRKLRIQASGIAAAGEFRVVPLIFNCCQDNRDTALA